MKSDYSRTGTLGYRTREYHLSGPIAGVSGLVVFLVLHHLWIMPIWFILPVGLPIALAGGLAVSWAYAELLPWLPPRPWSSIAMIGLVAVVLTPAFVLAELRSPMFDTSGPGGAVLLMSTGRAALIFVFELLATATLTGAAAGWLISRNNKVTLATSLAAFAFAAGPGHNIPFGGGTPAVGLEIQIMVAVVLVSVAVLEVTGAFRISSREPSPIEGSSRTSSGALVEND